MGCYGLFIVETVSLLWNIYYKLSIMDRVFNRIFSRTPSKFVKTSLFQNLNTLYPSEISQFVLGSSLSLSISCWPPSISRIKRFSKQTKSTMYLPIVCCLLKLNPASWLRRRCRHNRFSASVRLFLRFLERLTRSFTCAQPKDSAFNPLPHQGGGNKRLTALTQPFYLNFIFLMVTWPFLKLNFKELVSNYS